MKRNLYFPVLESEFRQFCYLTASMCTCCLGIGAIGGIIILGMFEKPVYIGFVPIIAMISGFFCAAFMMRNLVKNIVKESLSEEEK